MENDIWHLTDDFHRLPPQEILKNILRDDKKNYCRAETELRNDIELLDRTIALYIESLQAVYRNIEVWKSNKCNQASIAMAVSTLNYILLARHSIFLGYYPEVQDLLRNCYERISRCYLFFLDEKFATRFLNGKQIGQCEVDKELSRLEEDSQKREELLISLRKHYGFMSDIVHPNLKSFEGRYGNKCLGEIVGLEYVLGGIISAKSGHITIIRVLQTVLSALRILGIITQDKSGSWDKEYQEIKLKCENMVYTL